MDLIELDTFNDCVPIIAKPLIPSPINNNESNCITQNGLICQDNLNNNPFDKVLYETNCNETKENDPFENVFAKSLHNQMPPKTSRAPIMLLQPSKNLTENKLLIKIDDSNDSKCLEKECVEDKLIEIDQSLHSTDNFLLNKNPILKRKDLQHVIGDLNTSSRSTNASIASLNNSSLQCLSDSILEEDKLLSEELKRKDLKQSANDLNISNRSINEFVASLKITSNTSLECLSDSILDQNKSLSGKLKRKDLQHVIGDLNPSNRSANASVASVNNSSLQCLNDSILEQDKSYFEKLPESESNDSCQETSRETKESQWVRRSFSVNYNDRNSDCPDQLSMSNLVTKPNTIIQKTAELKRPEFRRSWSAGCFQNVNKSVMHRSSDELDKIISNLKLMKNEVIGSVSSQGTLNEAFVSMDGSNLQRFKISSSQSDLSIIGSSFVENKFVKQSHSLNTFQRANESNFFVTDRGKNLFTKSFSNANEIFNGITEAFDDSVFVEANNLADTFSKLAESAINSSSDISDDILNIKPPDWNAINLSADEDKPTKDVFQIIDKIFPETEKNELNLNGGELNVDNSSSSKLNASIDLLSPVNPLPTLTEGNQNTDRLLRTLRNFVSKNEDQMVDESIIIKLSNVLSNSEQSNENKNIVPKIDSRTSNEIDNITRDTVFNLQEKIHFLEEQLKTFMSHDSKQLNKDSDTVNEKNDQCKKLLSESVINAKKQKVAPLQIVQNNPLSACLKKSTESKNVNVLDKIKLKRNIGNAANVEKRKGPLKAMVPIGVMVKDPVTKDKSVKNTRKISMINATPPRISTSKTNAPQVANTPENVINKKPMMPVAQSTPNNRKEDISHAMSSPSPHQQQLSRNSWHFNKSISPSPVSLNITPNVSSLHRKRTSEIEPRSLPKPMQRKSYSSIPTVKSTMTRVKSTGDIEINCSLHESNDRLKMATKTDTKTEKNSLDNTASRKLSVLSSVNRDRKSTGSFFGNKLRPVNLISKLHRGSFAKGKENVVPE